MDNQSEDRRSRRFGAVLLLVALVAAAHFTWLVARFGGMATTRVFSEETTMVVALIAAAMCAAAAERSKGKKGRRSWMLLAAAATCWAFGQLVVVVYDVVLVRAIPSISLADAGHLAFVPLVCAACASLVVPPEGRFARARNILDGLIVAAVLLFLGWLMTFGPLVNSLTGYHFGDLVAVAYPLGDIAIATVVLSTLLPGRGGVRVSSTTLIFLGVGIGAFLLSDTFHSIAIHSRVYESGDMLDEGWFAGFLALALAASRPVSVRPCKVATSTMVGQVLPSLAAAAVLTVVIAGTDGSGHVDRVSVWLASCLVVFVLVRQVVTLLEEQGFSQLLEATVAERTAQLSQRESQFRTLVQHSSDVVLIVHEDGAVGYVSPSAQHVLGYTADEMRSAGLDFLVHESDRARVSALLTMVARMAGMTMTAEWRVRRADGDLRQVEVLIRNLTDESAVGGIVLNIRDVTERKELEAKLTHQALHDDLTGLANRSLLRVRIEQALARWLFQSEPFTVVVVDLDDFKSITDSLGHVAGDYVLRTIAERLGTCIRRGDALVRLEGDEFAVLLEGVSADDQEAELVAQRILDAVNEPMRVEGRRIAVRASVGLACVTEQVGQAEDLFRNADLALHQAKSTRRGGFVKFELNMHDSALRRIELEADLRRALERDELQLYYQPTVDLKTGRIDGVEALLRWPHPEKGFISPADFIPIAEESGLVVPLGTWVLEQACMEVRKWQARYPGEKPLTLNVNLSGRQLDQPDVVETVRRVLDATGLAPGSLVLEMTETVLMDNKPSTLAKMQALNCLGVRLAIDDFGTGYSSLSYLRQFPIGILKIDRSFVMNVGTTGNEDDVALVRAIVDLARALKLDTVAEGIETEEQLVELRKMGCDIGQGYLLAMPAPAEEVRRLIARLHVGDRPLPVAVVSAL